MQIQGMTECSLDSVETKGGKFTFDEGTKMFSFWRVANYEYK